MNIGKIFNNNVSFNNVSFGSAKFTGICASGDQAGQPVTSTTNNSSEIYIINKGPLTRVFDRPIATTPGQVVENHLSAQAGGFTELRFLEVPLSTTIKHLPASTSIEQPQAQIAIIT